VQSEAEAAVAGTGRVSVQPFEVWIPIAFFFSVAAIVILRAPLGKALADRIAGRAGDRSGLDRLSVQLGELSERVAELEERLDFAERLLVRRGDRLGLPGEG
jgi:hypothetical protein